MAKSSESVGMEIFRNAAVENPEKSASVHVEAPNAAMKSEESTSADVEEVEDVVVKNTASIDTTDKKTKQENSFAAKKTVAQGMMDVALITANANQLRYLIEYQRGSPTFYFIVILISISLLLQVTQCRGCGAAIAIARYIGSQYIARVQDRKESKDPNVKIESLIFWIAEIVLAIGIEE